MMRRRLEYLEVVRGDAGAQPARTAAPSPQPASCREEHPRYPTAWARDRARYPGEIALRDLGSCGGESHDVLVLARFAVCRWLDRLLLAAPAEELEAERKAALAYVAVARPTDAHPAGKASPSVEGRAAATLLRLTDASGPSQARALLAGLREASEQAALLDQPGGAHALGRAGYLISLGLGAWLEARRFARNLADHAGRCGAPRAAARWRRRAQALQRRIFRFPAADC